MPAAMTDAWIVGASSTRFERAPDKSTRDLAREAYCAALADAGMETGDAIEMGWFSNCGMWVDGQASIRGQVLFTPLVREGLFPERVPMINVEGGCASAQMALHGAWKDILSGQSDCQPRHRRREAVQPAGAGRHDGGLRGRHRPADAGGMAPLLRRGRREEAGKPFEEGPDRTVFMDTYAMQACWHMKVHGTTQRQIAASASKNHRNGALNEKAQYSFDLSVDDVLNDRPVSWPLTRAMCSPVGDGAAAVLVCSADFLRGQPREVQDRAIRIRASVLAGGKYRRLDEPGLSRTAAQRAYAMAGVGPQDIDVAELHDATSFCEIYQAEMMGFAEIGKGGELVESGATAIDGRIPVNTSGGLVSKGHPVGATGLSMIYELARQLRGEAGARQVEGAELALSENGGGVIGFDEAACAVTILERAP